MGLLTYTNLEDGDSAAANPFNIRFGQIIDEMNGNLDAANLANDAVTEAKIASDAVTNAKVNFSLTTSGAIRYINLGGFMIMWGKSSIASTGTTVTFPAAFSAVPAVTATIKDTNDRTAWITNITSSTLAMKQPWTSSALEVNWIAMGPV